MGHFQEDICAVWARKSENCGLAEGGEAEGGLQPLPLQTWSLSEGGGRL